MEIVLKEVKTLLDPFDIYSIFKDEINITFLDSGMDFDTLGRYSFIGINPFCVLKGNEEELYINDIKSDEDIFHKLRELLCKHKIQNNTSIPFIGGCIGYISYDYGLSFEKIHTNSVEGIDVPQFYFIFYDNLIIFDNLYHTCYISACGLLNTYDQSIALIEDKILKQKKVVYKEIQKSNILHRSNFSREKYLETLSTAIEYIRSGDIYIVNITQRFEGNTDKDSYEIYKDLRKINPAPFAAFMKLDRFDVISSSPERFLKIEDRLVETRPIKGTRPRSSDPCEDAYNKNQLLNSEKDKAELLMIVDLERNDLSKVCKNHTVKVRELFKLEEYSTVFHLSSTITGELKEEYDALECLKACFPGGSITGTPKIRAMEIIDELEGLKRSLYTGSIGYFSFDGNADFNIIIRTIIKNADKVYFGVGGGITSDSNEEEEYQETLDKAKALIEVL